MVKSALAFDTTTVVVSAQPLHCDRAPKGNENPFKFHSPTLNVTKLEPYSKEVFYLKQLGRGRIGKGHAKVAAITCSRVEYSTWLDDGKTEYQ